MIKFWINEEGQETDSWEKLIKKAITTKAKAKMQLVSSQNIDQYCYYEKRSGCVSLDKVDNFKKPKALN